MGTTWIDAPSTGLPFLCHVFGEVRFAFSNFDWIWVRVGWRAEFLDSAGLFKDLDILWGYLYLVWPCFSQSVCVRPQNLWTSQLKTQPWYSSA